jgi:hypothetical protein
MSEQWQPIPHTDGWYEVSDHGRVRSWRVKGQPCGARLSEPRLLALCVNGAGYRVVGLAYPTGVRVTRTVHQLVLETFVGPQPVGTITRHLDEDPLNCHLSNLSWGTYEENWQDITTPRTRFTAEESAQVFQLHRQGVSMSQIARRVGRAYSSVRWHLQSDRPAA